MRLFQYEVTDRQGNEMRGNLQAASSDAARMALSNAGYTVKNVRELSARLAAAPPAGAPQPTSRPTTAGPAAARPVAASPVATSTAAARPVARPAPEPAAQVVRSVPATSVVRTRRLSDKATSLLFAQFAARVRAGANVAVVLEDFSKRERRADLRGALHDAAETAKSGRSMCDAFERYPDLFAEDVVATLRAGELGGFLPAAADMISIQRQRTHRVRLESGFHVWYFVLLLSTFPFSWAVINGSLRSIAAQDKAGGELPIGGELAKGIGSQMGGLAIQAILLFALVFGLHRVWLLNRMAPLRHQLFLSVPGFARRTRMESLDRFCSVFGLVAQSGVSAFRCFEAAAHAVPNLVMRANLVAASRTMRENQPIASALRHSNVLPQEYVDVIENGELAGNVPGSFDQVAVACADECERLQNRSVITVRVLGYAATGLLTLILAAILMTRYYGGLIHTLTQD